MSAQAHALAKPYDDDPATATCAADVLSGLGATPKRLPPKYFYDATGSALFEEITRLPEYYPTRTELGILRERGGEIAALIPDGAALVEFGAGATTKARLLLASGTFGAYVPVDISGQFLNAQARQLRADLPGLPVHPVTADFTTSFVLPKPVQAMPKAGFFPGSTLGNFSHGQAREFLARTCRLLTGGGLLIGIDLVKDVSTLLRAYDDPQGVTAAFNLNLLRRANRELGADFDLSGFRHRAVYDARLQRIEMNLVSRRPQAVTLLGRRFDFAEGAFIHTESSHKYTVEGFRDMARAAGFEPGPVWTDPQRLFSVHWLKSPA